jgi:hypothetical protein
VCFALNVPSPSALHPPHLGGIWIDSANEIRICGFLAWVQVLMLKFKWTFSDSFFLNTDSMCLGSRRSMFFQFRLMKEHVFFSV